MQPQEITSARSASYILKVAKALPSSLGVVDYLLDEWKALQLQGHLIKNKTESIDAFWKNIFNQKNSGGLFLYPSVSKIVKIGLSISHGSADVERGFSQSGRILTLDKASMSVRMLNSRQYIKDGLKSFDNRVELVPITNQLLLLAWMANA